METILTSSYCSSCSGEAAITGTAGVVGAVFDEVEPDLRAGWNSGTGSSWAESRKAVRDSFDRIRSRSAKP